MKILVTGGAGFIGSAVIRHLVMMAPCHIVNVDKLTYSACPENLDAITMDPRLSARYAFERADICDEGEMEAIFRRHEPDAVIHLAAESHVDRSIEAPDEFIRTNVNGTATLLNAALSHYERLPGARKDVFRFVHVSTDEVYGSLGPGDDAFTEETPYAPRSPYSASKAASDHLAHAWHHTYGLPVIVTNCSNNYGPCQFPEKLIPVTILRCLKGEDVQVYGTGTNIRDWLYVEDHAHALMRVLERGRIGGTYNIGGEAERSNLDVVRGICALMDEVPEIRTRGGSCADLIRMVEDRPGHDFRYAMNISKIREELGWHPSLTFEEGLRKTVQWYMNNREWLERIHAGRYAGQRMGARRKDGQKAAS